MDYTCSSPVVLNLTDPPRIWRLARPASEDELKAIGGFEPVVAQILVNRGISSPSEAEDFLNGRFESLADPFLMADMDLAVKRIYDAIQSNELIAVYGDYDADGLTSAALLSEVLEQLGARVMVKIPNREEEGYGLNRSALQELAEREGVGLVLSVDCGIGGHEEIVFARTIGMDVVVTDHHEASAERPPAVAVVDPKQAHCAYPFKELAGVGVAFTLVRALVRSNLWQTDLKAGPLLDLVALGTVADVVPLVGENRLLVKYGLNVINRTKRPGLQALISQAGIRPGQVDTDSIGFALAPRINAAGRVADASVAYQLLKSATIEEARALATALEQRNIERQQLTERALKDARELLIPYLNEKLLLVAGDDWNSGVIGLVAGRLTDELHRPVLVVQISEDDFRGSARSIPGFNIAQALVRCDDLLLRSGGHAQAAGFSGHIDNIDALRERLCFIASEEIPDEALQPITDIDCEINLSDVSMESWQKIMMLAPFGIGNPAPVFLARGLRVASISSMGATGQHIRMQVTDNTCNSFMEAVGFRMSRWIEKIGAGSRVDAVFTIGINEWNGNRRVRMYLRDLNPCD